LAEQEATSSGITSTPNMTKKFFLCKTKNENKKQIYKKFVFLLVSKHPQWIRSCVSPRSSSSTRKTTNPKKTKVFHKVFFISKTRRRKEIKKQKKNKMQMKKKGIDASQGPPPQRTSSRAINFIISQIGEARRWSDMIVALRDLTRHNVVVALAPILRVQKKKNVELNIRKCSSQRLLLFCIL
jgi:hypothetical protein